MRKYMGVCLDSVAKVLSWCANPALGMRSELSTKTARVCAGMQMDKIFGSRLSKVFYFGGGCARPLTSKAVSVAYRLEPCKVIVAVLTGLWL